MATLDPLLNGRRALLAIAAPAEARAALQGLGADPSRAHREWERLEIGTRLDLVVTGVGKANAAGAVAQAIDASRHALVLNLGVAGALPGSQLEPTDSRIGRSSVFADEGLLADEGFADLGAMGFPPIPGGSVSFAADPAALHALAELAPLCEAIATVSTCSGTNEGASEIVRRTGAQLEAMEGAAIATVCARLAIPFVEMRVVSNTTGARASQRWDLRAALDELSRLAALL